VARKVSPLEALAARLPRGGVVVRHAIAQLERSLAPGERPQALYTGLCGEQFGVLLVTDQRVAFVDWTNHPRTPGTLQELPRGAIRVTLRRERDALAAELRAPRGSLAVSALQPADPAPLQQLR
jgi:hypothetical protein